ncbi:hypothetical protein PhaeoP23_03932 (plasmid) [Phaeobacter piscinae]|uniref:Lipoprotein n=1 Tax=Phaeobacter piscinae TaxID=1580596 RepID=A0ABM6PK39_9RHOB|nr:MULTISPECIES: hypothetical protein [Phaeobacter]ATG38085.1 hypothetical protein PhaeoP36_04010 [Phaeobacter piscinae]AUQ88606.1 hypothetical protein PhaeoP42_04011 [Phaeobacter piscinae]AUQ92595.1 hypothetical protein PhaeoP24_04037 [Phaeobacter inhibens]AUR26411.1 hypothetical protein PhaeoP23_03932 [Phaeobacter piscinae]
MKNIILILGALSLAACEAYTDKTSPCVGKNAFAFQAAPPSGDCSYRPL